MSYRKKLTFLFLTIFLLGFIFANRHIVAIHFNPFSLYDRNLSFEAPLFLWLLSTIILGFFIGYLKNKHETRRYKKALKTATKQLEILRKNNKLSSDS